MLVFFDTILYVAQQVIKARRHWPGLTIGTKRVALARLHVVELRDRTDYGSRSARPGLFESRQLFFGNGPTFYLHSQIARQLHQAVVGNAWQDGC